MSKHFTRFDICGVLLHQHLASNTVVKVIVTVDRFYNGKDGTNNAELSSNAHELDV